MTIYRSSDDTEYTVAYDQAGYTDGDAPAHHWSAVTLDGETISELWAQIDDEDGIQFRAGQIIQVETEPAYRREGIARQLYAIAYEQLGGALHHSPEEHRTHDGHAWAQAVD
ncbi:GNAT family N-acetyltransferase [Glycomyces artemisiae]|uniref:N-acetyltransferase domain-containing protein n=1 Tax=Glycomyces artemisiae TaxID=1076443 RepID=A0A2T0UF18_9ACTN|nr:GNAT family N-acetyltransferase [Glycomyces artemisiae]PRY56417.1 hypothetical protein B0I28_10966 [Glycomyces artemisiae]